MTRIIVFLLLCCSSGLKAQFAIYGTIYWPDGSVLDIPATMNVTIKGTGGQILNQFDLPVENGEYNFIEINPLIQNDIELYVTANVDPRARVTVLDIIRLQKHLFGLDPFDNALQIYAGDVNNSQSISALDLVEIRKIILGLNSEWQHKPAIAFFVRTGDDPPPIGTVLESLVTIPYDPDPPSHGYLFNFWAVKTGDVHW